MVGGRGSGAIAGCRCSVLRFGGEGDDQLWESGRGAIAEGGVTKLWGVDVVPLQGAIVVCYCWGREG